jgi:hypothetical protein
VLPPDEVNGLTAGSLYDFFFSDDSQTYFARPVFEKVTVPQNVIETWSDSTMTIKEPAEIDTSGGWTKPSPDPVAELARNVTLGIYPKNK